MSGPIPGGKAFATLQARAALKGRSLIKAHDHTGGDVVVLLDRTGRAHRVHSMEQLEDVLYGVELQRPEAGS